MSLNIGLLNLASSLANYAYTRQGVVANNIANSDTPGFKARDLRDFSDIAAESAPFAGGLRATRAGHIGFTGRTADLEPVVKAAFGMETPNGNTVSLEDQMIRSAEVQQQHDLALGIYSKSLNILRQSLGRG